MTDHFVRVRIAHEFGSLREARDREIEAAHKKWAGLHLPTNPQRHASNARCTCTRIRQKRFASSGSYERCTVSRSKGIGEEISTGVLRNRRAIRLRKEIDNEWLLMMHGALAVLFGLMVLVRPGAGALALIWLIASFAFASGVLLVALAFRLKSHHANTTLAPGTA
jgi:Short repeat of unknown function (DUF308)